MKATFKKVLDAVDALPEANFALRDGVKAEAYHNALADCLTSLGWTEEEYDRALCEAIMSDKAAPSDAFDPDADDAAEIAEADRAYWSRPTRPYCAPITYISMPWRTLSCIEAVPADDNIPF